MSLARPVALVGDEVGAANDGGSHSVEVRRHAARPGVGELDAIDRRKDVDAQRREPDLNHDAGPSKVVDTQLLERRPEVS